MVVDSYLPSFKYDEKACFSRVKEFGRLEAGLNVWAASFSNFSKHCFGDHCIRNNPSTISPPENVMMIRLRMLGRDVPADVPQT